MEIIQKPKSFGKLEFSCPGCGTVWRLEPEEYVPVKDYELTPDGKTEIPSWEVRQECPSCDYSVFLYFPTGEPGKRHRIPEL